MREREDNIIVDSYDLSSIRNKILNEAYMKICDSQKNITIDVEAREIKPQSLLLLGRSANHG